MYSIKAAGAFDPSEASWQSQGQNLRSAPRLNVCAAGAPVSGGAHLGLARRFFNTFVTLSWVVDGAILMSPPLFLGKSTSRCSAARHRADVVMATMFGRFESQSELSKGDA